MKNNITKMGLTAVLVGIVVLIISVTRSPSTKDVFFQRDADNWSNTTDILKYSGIGLILIGGIALIQGNKNKAD